MFKIKIHAAYALEHNFKNNRKAYLNVKATLNNNFNPKSLHCPLLYTKTGKLHSN